MNRKGFTLVELLVMLVVLGILIGITIPNISGIVSSQKVNATKDDALKLVDTAKMVVASENKVKKPKQGECVIFTLDYLDTDSQFLNGPYGGEYSRYDSYVIFKREGGTYKYYVKLVEKLDNGDFGVNLTSADNLTSDGTKYVSKIKEKTSFSSSSSISDISSNSEIQTICPTGSIKRYNDVEQETTNAQTTSSFVNDSWETIIAAYKSGNTSAYPIGSTKPIELKGLGTYTVRLVNTSACSSSVNSKTACGVVFEFTDVVFKKSISAQVDSNAGGWKNSQLRTYLNSDFLNMFPSIIRNAIVETKVESGHGYDDNIRNNFVSKDKIYLFSTKELLGGNDPYDSVTDTRQLDYYSQNGVSLGNQTMLAKADASTPHTYWLRSAVSTSSTSFYSVGPTGYFLTYIPAGDWDSVGVAPAFKIV